MKWDEHFRRLGAVAVYDETYPVRTRRYDGQPAEAPRIFARYYFNAQGLEIGYSIPDLLQFQDEPNVHPTPRVWGIAHDLKPL